VALVLAAFLFRPPSVTTGVAMVVLVAIAVAVADRLRTDVERSRR
jgi:H+/gluconate symporter-like permease